MTHWGMYWFTRLDALQGFGVAMSIVSGFLVVGGLIFFFIEEEVKALKFSAIVAVPFFFCLSIALLTPTQKEAAAIWLIPKMVNNEQIENIATNSLNILEEYTKEYLVGFGKNQKEE